MDNTYILLKTRVLNWLETLKVPNTICQYKFSLPSNNTIFCTCFALFILDLFKETDNFAANEKEGWIYYIQSFQNQEYGYFEPEEYYYKDKERTCYQLTCFCLSALKILNSKLWNKLIMKS